jgi:hypothetical protein
MEGAFMSMSFKTIITQANIIYIPPIPDMNLLFLKHYDSFVERVKTDKNPLENMVRPCTLFLHGEIIHIDMKSFESSTIENESTPFKHVHT